MKYSSMVCSFTGYRPQKLPFGSDENSAECVKLKGLLLEEIARLIEKGYSTFQSGMALGVDIYCAEAVLALKRDNPGIKLNCVLPCLEQAASWQESDKARYDAIIAHADKVICVSERPYFDGCMKLRNEYLVNTCDALLAVYSNKPGGTKQTVDYARKLGRPVVIIDPYTFIRAELHVPQPVV